MADEKLLEKLKGELVFQADNREMFTWENAPGSPDDPLDISNSDLSNADLAGAILLNTRLSHVDLQSADLSNALMMMTDLQGSNLSNATLKDAVLDVSILDDATLDHAVLNEARLEGATLNNASLENVYARTTSFERAVAENANFRMMRAEKANFCAAELKRCCFDNADLSGCDFQGADLTGSSFRNANLEHANFRNAVLQGADLTGADLSKSVFVETNLKQAILNKSRVYGVAVWDVQMDEAEQLDLIVTPRDEAEVTVDDLAVAQFVYLMLTNSSIRNVIDGISSKGVLILGRFNERKANLDAMRNQLRELGYLPLLFDFAVPENRDITETVRIMAGISKFIIVDLSDPRSVPQELQAIVPNLKIPVKTIISEDQEEYSMLSDLYKYPWLIREPYRYKNTQHLIESFESEVIEALNARMELLESL